MASATGGVKTSVGTMATWQAVAFVFAIVVPILGVLVPFLIHIKNSNAEAHKQIGMNINRVEDELGAGLNRVENKVDRVENKVDEVNLFLRDMGWGRRGGATGGDSGGNRGGRQR